jgi:hypothetical protein
MAETQARFDQQYAATKAVLDSVARSTVRLLLLLFSHFFLLLPSAYFLLLLF